MGNEVDEQRKYFPLKIGCICSSLGNIFFRVFLRHFLVKKKIFDARTYFFKRTNFKGLGTSYRFCLPSVFSDAKQIDERKNSRNYM
jgi:hypothetical protein